MQMDNVDHHDDDRMTYFARLPDELLEETERSSLSSFGATNFLTNVWGNLFKTSSRSHIDAHPSMMLESRQISENSMSNTDLERNNIDSPTFVQSKDAEQQSSSNDPIEYIRRSSNKEENIQVPGRLASIFKNKDPSLIDYNRSDFRRYWMPDSCGRECYECQERFTAFKRRHHCRLCGQIFCSKCCHLQIPGVLLGYSGDLRLCSYCAQSVVTNLPHLEAKMENIPVSPNDGHKESIQSDASVSTIFAGPVKWSLDGSDASESDIPSPQNLSKDKSLAKHGPSQLSVAELMVSDVSAARTLYDRMNGDAVVGNDDDEHEPEWVKNIEMTETLKPLSYASRNTDGSDSSHHDQNRDFHTNVFTSNNLVTSEQIKAKLSVNSTKQNDGPAIDEDVEQCFEEQSEKLLLHLFKREGLDPSKWWDIIWSVSHRVASVIKPELDLRKNKKSSAEVLQLAHIKKLHTKVKSPSAVVIDGVVCCQSVRHDSMPCNIQNASVLILEGSIEFERVNDKLSSIEPIIAQEREYLKKLVERLLAHRPSVVLVEQNVAGLAIEMLRHAGVAVICNVKRQVLMRIARCSMTDIMPSLDAQILTNPIGFCPRFKQEKIRLCNGQQKCLLYFSDCAPELGCTVLLKWRNKNELRAVKRILRCAILALYSNSLEVKFFKINQLMLTKRCINCVVCAFNTNELDSSEGNFYERLKNSTLSSSPLITFGIPVLETNRGRRSCLRKFFNQFISSSSAHFNWINEFDLELSDSEEAICEGVVVETENKITHPFITDNSLVEIDEDMVASFRAFSGWMFHKQLIELENQTEISIEHCNYHDADVLDPYAHQGISVLFGSFCSKSPNSPFFCIHPWVLNIEYYGANDMSLGDFLYRFCFNKEYKCSSANCDLPVMDHSRKFVHRNVCIEVITQNYLQVVDATSVSSQTNDSLLTWQYCSSCKSSSSISLLTSGAARLSFGRYLNYLANGAYTSGKITLEDKICDHCWFHQTEHFFALKNYVASFKVFSLRPHHITFSPLICTVEHMLFTRKLVAESEVEITHMATTIFSNMFRQTEYLESHSENSLCLTYLKQITKIVQGARENFSTMIKSFDATGALSNNTLTIRSNDAVYTQALDTICRCRYIIQHAIDQWNDQCSHFSQQLRLIKKNNSLSILQLAPALPVNFNFSSENNTEVGRKSSNDHVSAPKLNDLINGDVEIMPIESPFAAENHLSLPLPANGMATIVVRDIIDQKGSIQPDIGSIIAYALSSVDYNNKLRIQRKIDATKEIVLENEIASSLEHIEVDFADDRAQYYVKVYHAERFSMLRKLLFVEGEDSFIRSLSSSRSWKPQGGKSGASFYRTQDDRFVFKQMSRFEIQSFVKFGPNYFSYVSAAMTEKKLTTLCKVYGVFRICYKNRITGHQLKVDILVMEFLFYKRNVKQVWDLKGSQRNRMASEGKRTADLVLLDENLVKDLWNNQLYVHPYSKAALTRAIINDSRFLSAQYVMDYSLLVGVDETNNELILGIVDYMRTYTLDKKLESWVKIVTIPGGHLPTVISPEMYCARFCDAIDTYFPVAPDQWMGLGSELPTINA